VTQELLKYSPQMMECHRHRKQSVQVGSDLRDRQGNMKMKFLFIHLVASVLKDDYIAEYNKYSTDFEKDNIIITFDGLINKTPMISQIQKIMKVLQDKLGYPVDIEFASDGQNFYLLQCRPQSKSQGNYPVAIPSNIAAQNMVFTANKYISNGKVTGIRTVVYVDPEEYGRLENHQDLVNVGNAISELNRILYRRSFILMGPGRWGSRGDIRLGVQVSYSDINNCSMLIEIAKKKSRYQPELSFGTHFFQDLVEANIKYLPLYPEDSGILFDKSFFIRNTNALETILPSYGYLSNVIKVINISENYF